MSWVAKVPKKKLNKVEVRLYENLFLKKNSSNWEKHINPKSISVHKNAIVDDFVFTHTNKSGMPLSSDKLYDTFQFEREGYFHVDKSTTNEKIVFNRVVSLKKLKKKKHLRINE